MRPDPDGPGPALLVRGGVVITLDPATGTLTPGEVLVAGGVIRAVGERIPPEQAAGAEVIDVPGSIVLPGFIDTHRHTWQAVIRQIAADWTLGHYMTGIHAGLSRHFRPEDTYIGNLLGTLEALDSGITTLLDWSHNLATPEHADAAVQALLESGARAVFAHGGGAPQWQAPPSPVPHPQDARRVRDRWFSGEGPDQGLVTMAMALRGPQFATKETTVDDFRLARDLGLRVSVHVGDGEWGRTRPVAWMREAGLLGDDVTYVHCNTLADDELAMIAGSGGTASVSADIELSMGHGWPATGRLLAAGIRPSLSIDVCTLNSGDMFGAMRSTIASQRALANAEAAARGTVVDALVPSCPDVVGFATVEGARATGLLDRTGSLTVGKDADLIVLSTDSPGMFPLNNPWGAIVYSGHPGTVDTVLVRGNVRKRGGRLVGADLARVRRLAEASRDRLFARAADDPATADAHLGGTWFPAPMTAAPPP
jgi:5-methylthioadenosine/S-adenosylhomocysteine deaminase